jgi:hypothetical protein
VVGLLLLEPVEAVGSWVVDEDESPTVELMVVVEDTLVGSAVPRVVEDSTVTVRVTVGTSAVTVVGRIPQQLQAEAHPDRSVQALA